MFTRSGLRISNLARPSAFRRSAVAVAAAALAVASLVAPSAPAEANAGNFVMSQGVYGPNQAVTVELGVLSRDSTDLIFTISDLYTVPAGSVSAGGAIDDPSGFPNTVISGTLGSAIFDELVGFTTPGGNIGPGLWDVIEDANQNGVFDGPDTIARNAFRVVIPVNPPPVPATIAQIKSDAATAKEKWKDAHKAYTELFALADAIELYGALTDPADALLYLFGQWAAQVIGGPDPKLGTLVAILNKARHYQGIAADPPNPDFRHLTPLGPRPVVESVRSDLLDQELVRVINASSTEAELARALLDSVERYQGADQAQDGEWALIHARAIAHYARALADQLAETSDALAAAHAALNADLRAFDPLAGDLEAFLARVTTTGFTEDELRAATNLGFSESDLDEFLAVASQPDFTGFSKAAILNLLADLQATNAAFIGNLDTFAGDFDGIAATLAANPEVADLSPDADAGGPYTGVEGSSITFDGSGSSAVEGSVASWDWDLDGDGEFDDRSGPAPSFSYPAPFVGVVGLRVTTTFGRQDIGYAPITVTDINGPPSIDTSTPADGSPIVLAGASLPFSVSVSDPDSDTISVAWIVDGVSTETGASFTFSPTLSDVGAHSVEVLVSDDSALSPNARRVWTVTVEAGDGDSDGWNAAVDCDDGNGALNPGADEVLGDGLDNDCNAATPDSNVAPAVDAGPDIVVRLGDELSIEALIADSNRPDAHTATVDWGDGSAIEPLSVTQTESGASAAGSHSYGAGGSFVVEVCATDLGSLGNCDQATVTVADLSAVLSGPDPGTEYITFWAQDLRILAQQPNTLVTLIDIDTGALLDLGTDSRISSTNFASNPFVLSNVGDSFEGIGTGGTVNNEIRVRVVTADSTGGSAVKPVTVWAGWLSSAQRHPASPPSPGGNPFMSYIPANPVPGAEGSSSEVGRDFLGFAAREMYVFARKGIDATSITIDDLVTNVEPGTDDDDSVTLTAADAVLTTPDVEIYFLDGFEDDTVRINSNVEISVLTGLGSANREDWTVTPPSYGPGENGIELGTEFYTYAIRSLAIFPTQDGTEVTVTDLSDGDDSNSFTLSNGDTTGDYDIYGISTASLSSRAASPQVNVLDNGGNQFDGDFVKIEASKPVLVFVGPIASDTREFADVAFSVPTGPGSSITYAYAQNGGTDDLQVFGFDQSTEVTITSLTNTPTFGGNVFHDFTFGSGISGAGNWEKGTAGGDVWWGSGVWGGELLRIESTGPISVLNGDYDNAGFGSYIPFINVAQALPPQAQAGTDAFAIAGEPVHFDAGDSFDQDTESSPLTTTYLWDFDITLDSDGDGDPTNDVDATGPTPTHTYPDPDFFDDQQIFTAKLTVIDDEGQSDTDFVDVTIVQPSVAVVADAGGPYTINEGETVLLDGSGSFDPAGDSLSFEWDVAGNLFFGEFVEVSLPEFADDFETSVTLTVTSGRGAFDTETTDLIVRSAPPVVSGNTGGVLEIGVTEELVLATISDPGVNDTHTATANWGDGSDEEFVTVDPVTGEVKGSHTYSQTGLYSVQVCVIDSDGALGCDTIELFAHVGADSGGPATGSQYVTFWSGDLRIFAHQAETGVALINLDTNTLLPFDDPRVDSTNFPGNPFVLENENDSFEGIGGLGGPNDEIRLRVVAYDPTPADATKSVTVWTGGLNSTTRRGNAVAPDGNPWMSYIPSIGTVGGRNGTELGREFLGFVTRDMYIIARNGAEETNITVQDLVTNTDADTDDSVTLTPADAVFANSEVEAYILGSFEDDTVRVSSNTDISVLVGYSPDVQANWTATPPSFAQGDDGIELGTLFYTYVERSLTVFPIQDDTTVTITDLSDGDDSNTFTLTNGDVNGDYNLYTPILATQTANGINPRDAAPAVIITSNSENPFDSDFVKVESDKPVLVYVGPVGSDVNEFADVAFSVPTGPDSRIVYTYAQNFGDSNDLQIFAFDDDTEVTITSLSATTGFGGGQTHDFVIGPGIGGANGWLEGTPGGDVWWGSGVWDGEMLRIESTRPITVLNGDYDGPQFGAYIPFVLETPLLPPVAVAGPDQEVTAGDTVNLDGSGSFDQDTIAGPEPIGYTWDFDTAFDSDGDGDPANDSDSTSATPSTSYSASGVYTVKLTFSDDDGQTDTDFLDVTVNERPNEPPVADADGPYEVDEGSSIQLDGTGSTDPESGPLTFEWDLDSDGVFGETGAAAANGDEAGSTPTLDASGLNGPGSLTAILRVTDDGGLSDTDSTTITINNVPPTADAGGPYEVDEGSTVQLEAFGTDPLDPPTYMWDLDNNGTFETLGQTPIFNAIALDGPAVFTVTARVFDGEGGSTEDSTTVTVLNVAPSVSATGDTVAFGESATAAGTFSDPGIPDTHTARVDWGDGTPPESLGTVTSPFSPTHTYGTAGTYTVTVTVTDDDGGVGQAEATVVVTPPDSEPPVANAGGPYEVDEGSSVQLDASGSSDPENAALTYAWDLDGDGLFGESGVDAENGDETGVAPTFDAGELDGPALFTVALRVTDTGDLEDSAIADITVNNVAPTASFANDGPVDEGTTATVSFSGESDPSSADTAAGFLYSFDFENDGTFEVTGSTSNSAAVPAALTADGPATFTVAGRIEDKDGGFTDYTTEVTVNNVAPTAEATGDTIDEGDTATVDVMSTDPGLSDTHTATIDWGDGSALEDLGTVTSPFSPSHAYDDNGTYTVTVTVTDNDGGSGQATTSVTVNNVAPTAVFANDGPVDEGTTATVSFSGESDPSSADTAAGFLYSFDFENDGTFEVTGSTSNSAAVPAALTADGPATFTVAGRIEDKDGGFTDYTTEVTVNNVAPTATANGDVINEGGTATVSGTISDPGVNDALTVTIDWADGSPATVLNLPAGSTTYSATHAYPDDNPTGTAGDDYVVSLAVTDDDGGTGSADAVVTVNNVAPSVEAGPSAEINLGELFSLAPSSFGDAGVDDTHIATIDWGDGTSEAGIVTFSGGVGSVAGSHTYSTGGIFEVIVTVTDDDTGSSQDTLTVTVLEPQDEPGFMTGGGNFTEGRGKNTSRLTWGFVIHCDGSHARFQFNDHGTRSKFHLESVTEVSCRDDDQLDPGKPDAGFDTLTLSGTGRWNGESGATIEVTVTDAGEPGRSDALAIRIWDASGTLVETVPSLLTGGNHQAHPAEVDSEL